MATEWGMATFVSTTLLASSMFLNFHVFPPVCRLRTCSECSVRRRASRSSRDPDGAHDVDDADTLLETQCGAAEDRSARSNTS